MYPMEVLEGNGVAMLEEVPSEVAKEDSHPTKMIEHFDIPLDDLKMVFEKPAHHKRHHKDRATTPHKTSELVEDKERRSPGEKMFSKQDAHQAADSVSRTNRLQLPQEEETQRNGAAGPEDPEPVSVKERMAMFQTAVTRKEGATSAVLEESETCTVPGGLASVKKQFESKEGASHRTVVHYNFQHRSTQDTSQWTAGISGREIRPSSLQVSHDHSLNESIAASAYENHYDETIEGANEPKLSTQALKEQFERTIEEATPSKPIKTSHNVKEFEWPSAMDHPTKFSPEQLCETSSSVREVVSTASSCGTLEQFPPPPSYVVHLPVDIPECCCPEPLQMNPQKHAFNKQQYSKQKNLNELKRLYKHIHPEVRKNIQKDYFTDSLEEGQFEHQEEVSRDVTTGEYVFEDSVTSPNKCLSPEREYMEWDEILKGEVQSMRWMFENQPLDSIKDCTPDEYNTKNIACQEVVAGNDVKYTAWMFETQPMDTLGTDTPDSTDSSRKITELARGDVRTATWLFETQPLDSLNKIYQEEEETMEVVCANGVTGGDVKTARYLFETQNIDALGQTETIDESHFLHLKSELEEIRGGVKTTSRIFETQPLCVIRGDCGQMLEITSVCREESEKGDVKTTRWLFETQPLDMFNSNPCQVKLICGVSMEENYKGDVNRGRWLFETKTLDSVNVCEWEDCKTNKEKVIGGDVRKQCRLFETQPIDSLKDDSNARPPSQEEITGGDVQSARRFFETAPAEAFREISEVGKLQKELASENERGDVRHQKWLFESQSIESIGEERKVYVRTVNLEELDKGDVTNCKEIFESMDLSKSNTSQRIQVEGITDGSVKSNKAYFESTPSYAMEDSTGHYHEVKTVRREEITKGDVQSCRWMFETRPIDQFDESIKNFQLIKGISKQEVDSGDVKTAKWLFETQPLDSIKYFSNVEDDGSETKENTDVVKGDVKTCKWLFETQPMDVLYEKATVKDESEAAEINRGDVKTCTWLFETQALDTIGDESETFIKACTVNQDDIQGKDVQRACFLFETEHLADIGAEEDGSFKKVTEIDIQSGDVSKMKCVFENEPSKVMASSSLENMQKLKTLQAQDIKKGDVVNCTWLFENHPIDALQEHEHIRTVTDVQGGNVDKGRFIFETISLDKIQEESSETAHMQTVVREEIEKGDVKNYTSLFETQPLYAIKDKEGHLHEVTTVTKEDIMCGDVVGARWLFETKPLDCIKDSNEVYVIKAVSQEDVQKGDVSSARWRFETQPLDTISEDVKVWVKTIDNIQGGDVQAGRQYFESKDIVQNCEKTVSELEIQKGDVRGATWMFETNPIDKIHGEDQELIEIKADQKEEQFKGDVKQSVCIFEKQPLDCIKDKDENKVLVTREEIPQADVKSTAWLFETTPFHEFNESKVEKTEILGKSIKETLKDLYCQKMVNSQGILIEADEIGDIRMAKYKLMNQEVPEIQKEEVIKGDLQNIMMNLLNRQQTIEKGIVIDQEERGNINTTVKQLFKHDVKTNIEKEEVIRGDIHNTINNLLTHEGSAKHGILIQEDEKGDIKMTIYSLFNKEEETPVSKEAIIKGNIRSTLHRLLSSPDNEDQLIKIKVDETERGNVSFFSTCIESGALDFLQQLQIDPSEIVEDKEEKEDIIGGDIEGTKLILKRSQLQVGRTVAEDDIVRGDVHNTAKIFMTKAEVSTDNMQKEEIVKGDLKAALDSLTQAIHQNRVVSKEEVVKGDITTTLKSLEEAQSQQKDVEKPEIVPGDIKGALKCLEISAMGKPDVMIEDIVAGDVKGTLKCLEEAKQALKNVEKVEIVKGDISTALQNLQEASVEKKFPQQQVEEQGDIRGTIQLLMERPAACKTQRRASIEGDIKTSIQSLCQVQEHIQVEREEVIKGDIQGTIKCLLKQNENPKAKPVHAVRNLSQSYDSHHCKQKEKLHIASKAVSLSNKCSSLTSPATVIKNTVASGVNKSELHINTITKCTSETTTVNQTQTVLKTVTKNCGAATSKSPKIILKTESHNLGTSKKGLITINKKAKLDVCLLPSPPTPPLLSSDPEFPLPPPPVVEEDIPNARPLVMRQDSDLPPPPPPPPVETVRNELEHFPPPPPPPVADFDPSLSSLNFKKPIEKPATVPYANNVPKFDSPHQLQQVCNTGQKTQAPSNHQMLKPTPQSPHPPRKVFAPKMIPPSVETASAQRKLNSSKFRTPLMIAEERYRKQREEGERQKDLTTAASPPSYDECVNSTFQGTLAQKELVTCNEIKEIPQQIITTSTTEAPSLSPNLLPPKESISTLSSVESQRSDSESSKLDSSSKKTQTTQIVKTVSSTKLESSSPKIQVAPIHHLSNLNIFTPPVAPCKNIDMSFAVKQLIISPEIASSELDRAHQDPRFTQIESQSSADSAKVRKNNSLTAHIHKTTSSKLIKAGKVTPKVGDNIVSLTEVEDIATVQKQKDTHALAVQTATTQKSLEITKMTQQRKKKDGTQMTNSNVIHESTETVGEVVSSADAKSETHKKKKHKVKKEKASNRKRKDSEKASDPEQDKDSLAQIHEPLQEKCIDLLEISRDAKLTELKSKQCTFKQERKTSAAEKHINHTQVQKDHRPETPQKVSPSHSNASLIQSYEEMQKLLCHIKQLQGTIDQRTVKFILSKVPNWLIEPNQKKHLLGSENVREIIYYVQNLAETKLVYLEERLATSEKHNRTESLCTEAISTALKNSTVSDKQNKVVEASHECRSTEGISTSYTSSTSESSIKTHSETVKQLKDSTVVLNTSTVHQAVDFSQKTVGFPLTADEENHSETSESALDAVSVKDKRVFFEEAQKAEVTKTYTRKDPIHIPERLSPDEEEHESQERQKEEVPKVDLSELVHKFESPGYKVYARKEPIVIAERHASDLERLDSKDSKTITDVEELPAVDVRAIKSVFEVSEASLHGKQEKQKPDLELTRTSASGCTFKDVTFHEEKTAEDKSIVEHHLSCAFEQSSQTSRSKTLTTSIQHLDGLVTQRGALSYADAVKSQTPVTEVLVDALPEISLGKSESVSQSYAVSQQRTVQFLAHKEETVVSEDSYSRVRDLRHLSDEGLSDGVPHSRQTKLS